MPRALAVTRMTIGVVAFLAALAIPDLANAADPKESLARHAIAFHQYVHNKVSSEYIVEVMEDGAVTYTGIRNVRELGQRQFRVSTDTVRAAIRRILELRTTGL